MNSLNHIENGMYMFVPKSKNLLDKLVNHVRPNRQLICILYLGNLNALFSSHKLRFT